MSLMHLFPRLVISAVCTVAALNPAQAAYVVLNGSPVTQGQMRVSVAQYQRLQARNPSASDRFTLQETIVEAEISGVFARVRVSQVFRNPHPDQLDSLYVFPLPENAAVDRYEFQIGERVVRGVVKTREDARQAYEAARDAGRQAALLEQERPNIFSQSIANIPGNSVMTVRFEYVHPVDIDDENYVFRFPMVVGARYEAHSTTSRRSVGRGWTNDRQSRGASRSTSSPQGHGMRNGKDISITVKLDAGMPVNEVVAVTHELNVAQTSASEAVISLKDMSTLADKDFVFEYRLSGDRTVLSSLTHRSGDEDGYVSLVLQPKFNIERAERTAQEVILMLDTSGSMNGMAISQLRKFAQDVLEGLDSQDTFRMVEFNNHRREFRPDAVPATTGNIKSAKTFVRRLSAGGGTKMLDALKLALKSTPGEESRPRYLFLMTDALIGDDNSILGHMKNADYANVRFFPVAFGAAPNHYLIGRAAELGRGFAMQVTNEDNAAVIAQRFNEKTSAPYMTDIEIDWGELDIHDMIPSRLPDLYAGRPLVVMARYINAGSSKITLSGNMGGNKARMKMALELELPEREEAHDSLGTLWARQRIRQIHNRDLGQPSAEGRDEITQLGLTYQLVTQYTSFIAVESESNEEVVNQMVPEDASDTQREGQLAKRQQPSSRVSRNTPTNASRRAYSPQPPIRNPTPRPRATHNASPPIRHSGGGGGGGRGGGSVEWLFLGSIGLLAAARLRRRRNT